MCDVTVQNFLLCFKIGKLNKTYLQGRQSSVEISSTTSTFRGRAHRVYNKTKIQIFEMNMTFISSHDEKKMKYTFLASLDKINGIFITKICISSIYNY